MNFLSHESGSMLLPISTTSPFEICQFRAPQSILHLNGNIEIPHMYIASNSMSSVPIGGITEVGEGTKAEEKLMRRLRRGEGRRRRRKGGYLTFPSERLRFLVRYYAPSKILIRNTIQNNLCVPFSTNIDPRLKDIAVNTRQRRRNWIWCEKDMQV